MKLDDLQSPMQAKQLAGLLRKHYGITVPVDSMNHAQASVMLENVQRKLDRFRNTTDVHESQNNRNYLSLMMVEQVLRAKINEGPVWDRAKTAVKTFGKVVKPFGQAAKDIAGAAGSAAEKVISTHVPGGTYTGGTSLGSLKDRFKTYKGDSSGYDTGRSRADVSSVGRNLGVDPSQMRYLLTTPSIKNNEALADLFRKMSAHPNFNSVMAKLKNNPVSESVELMESSVGEAEVVLAAKDLADRIQDMVETLGKMVNEELPALAETIRDTMTPEQADAFNGTATETINGLLENVRGAKDTLDAAARTLAGEETPEPGTEAGAEDMDMTEPDTEVDTDLVTEPEVAPEPAGRQKR